MTGILRKSSEGSPARTSVLGELPVKLTIVVSTVIPNVVIILAIFVMSCVVLVNTVLQRHHYCRLSGKRTYSRACSA